jgi:hypothetical protein
VATCRGAEVPSAIAIAKKVLAHFAFMLAPLQ